MTPEERRIYLHLIKYLSGLFENAKEYLDKTFKDLKLDEPMCPKCGHKINEKEQ